MSVFGYSARRIVSAISLAITALFLAGSALSAQLGVDSIVIAVAIPIFVVFFVLGLFLHRVAISVSASVVLLHAVYQLTGLRVDYGHAVAVSVVLAFTLYMLSRRRGYLPYAILGTSAFAYFTSYFAHAVVAVSLAIAIGTASYAIQEKLWRVKIKYSKIRYSLKKRRRHTLASGFRLPRKSSEESKVESF
ncbi:MAG: hypothetical protein QXU65_01890 [Sulfolobales archaeon]